MQTSQPSTLFSTGLRFTWLSSFLPGEFTEAGQKSSVSCHTQTINTSVGPQAYTS
jgi:hypothetical protein